MGRLAVCGKGGVGKTALTAMLSRALLEGGKSGRLLAIDADPALGLTYALGMHVEKTMGQVREAILAAARSGAGAEMTEIAGMLDYMVMEALIEDESLALLAMGRSESLGCFCSVNDILRDAIKVLSRRFDTVVIDGEAGVEQINRQVLDELDWLIMVSDASSRGLQVVALLRELVEEKKVIRCDRTGVVFNRVRGDEHLLGEAAAKIGAEVLGFVPEDPAIAAYDLVGRSLRELPDDSVALSAVRTIAAGLPL
ncbi:MAG: AAA family ATPase [Thermoleophilia bacterium]|nr:AAA family ATPase [Thermoleophilia bacterium]